MPVHVKFVAEDGTVYTQTFEDGEAIQIKTVTGAGAGGETVPMPEPLGTNGGFTVDTRNTPKTPDFGKIARDVAQQYTSCWDEVSPSEDDLTADIVGALKDVWDAAQRHRKTHV